ncbi:MULTISPECIES: CpsD/CapB family tyrosine-protein kinase [Exiguobacterium]|uniref:CpsD/CapB family tyrosine-protein kinase n=2 Tax=Bacillales Family XII. Incertae Sedis TaxID=539742 RepID=UPI000E90790C|nr:MULTISPECIES: CpsD/CapB family tyrosine-protein kinase [Exiguobacterium]MDT0172784.1 CpsD/CapB family tyrosine-protein kinase [Exiguobacterium sp. BRG2]NTY10702.1 polysaccharide biosynthesis tyrosine autokinase [Exiguobacterium sp. JMULE1]HBF59497.1 capsular biosynthesis protein [Exiguobacterium sp.]HCV54109.1 capsular biosynthesis protein [Exiguobacterium sp.]
MAKKSKMNKDARKLITVTQPKSPVAEQYRTIRTNIEFMAVDREIQAILVTSATQGEGKSTTSSNLAVAYAQQGKKVLIIDTDMRRPTVHYTFKVANGLGLSSLLTRQAEKEKAILPTKVDNLSILTAGPIPPNPAELLSSRAMEHLVSQLRADFDVIIFDAPPLLQVADSRITSKLTDGVVLVVGCTTSDRQRVLKAKEQLDLAEAKILGVVLNRRELTDDSAYQYYYSYE